MKKVRVAKNFGWAAGVGGPLPTRRRQKSSARMWDRGREVGHSFGCPPLSCYLGAVARRHACVVTARHPAPVLLRVSLWSQTKISLVMKVWPQTLVKCIVIPWVFALGGPHMCRLEPPASMSTSWPLRKSMQLHLLNARGRSSTPTLQWHTRCTALPFQDILFFPRNANEKAFLILLCRIVSWQITLSAVIANWISALIS